MGDEQTVADALARGCRLVEHMQDFCGCDRRLEALGIDPGMSLERLRADLEIAARVRSVEPIHGSTFPAVQAVAELLGWFLLGDNP